MSARPQGPSRAAVIVPALWLTLAAAAAAPAEQLHVVVTYDPAITDSYTGRVYLMTSRGPGEPRHGPHWFGDDPFYAVDVAGWAPDAPLLFGASALAYPVALRGVPAGDYGLQAVMRRNADSPSIGEGAGTAYSAERRIAIDPAAGGRIDLRIDQVVAERPFRETDRIKLVRLRSELLSAFHGRPVEMRAAVVLPEGYDPAGRYGACYWINGFGGDHFSAHHLASMWDSVGASRRIVHVVPDPLCFGGHHVFADSASNGPRGRALVEELIPHLERSFALLARPSARFLGGHSSGGWSSLWLQVSHPEHFGGVWSVAPDPVDFTDFQRVDLYAPGANLFVDAQGALRPVARRGETPFAWYHDFVAMENVYGEGGQIRSFEWAFSPRGEDGLPRRLFDRTSGAVDPSVAAEWRRYDIRQLLERDWARLAAPLAGKIHVFMGERDTFYLEGATRRLKEALERLGSDAVIELVPGADHGSISSPQLMQRIEREMEERLERAVAETDSR
jgi:hypothetical protein